MLYPSYRFIENGKEIGVKPERWCWGVVYDNGGELRQFDDGGWFHQVREIEMDRVRLFVMYKSEDPSRRVDLVVDPERQQVFHYYLNVHASYFEDFRKTVRVYVFGFKHRGVSRACYFYILPDDRIVVADNESIDLTKFNL